MLGKPLFHLAQILPFPTYDVQANLTKLPVIDSITLTKPKGWKPAYKAAEALYTSTTATPPQVQNDWSLSVQWRMD